MEKSAGKQTFLFLGANISYCPSGLLFSKARARVRIPQSRYIGRSRPKAKKAPDVASGAFLLKGRFIICPCSFSRSGGAVRSARMPPGPGIPEPKDRRSR